MLPEKLTAVDQLVLRAVPPRPARRSRSGSASCSSSSMRRSATESKAEEATCWNGLRAERDDVHFRVRRRRPRRCCTLRLVELDAQRVPHSSVCLECVDRTHKNASNDAHAARASAPRPDHRIGDAVKYHLVRLHDGCEAGRVALLLADIWVGRRQSAEGGLAFVLVGARRYAKD